MVTTTRRTLEQIVHCAEEALSAHAAGEDPEHVLADLEQARADRTRNEGSGRQDAAMKSPLVDPREQLVELRDRAARRDLQLAACGVAALTGDPAQEAKEGDPGWSPAYADVLKLRREVESLRSETEALRLHRMVLNDALTASNSERQALRREIETLRGERTVESAEREATVRWLREPKHPSSSAGDYANAIERGDHRR